VKRAYVGLRHDDMRHHGGASIVLWYSSALVSILRSSSIKRIVQVAVQFDASAELFGVSVDTSVLRQSNNSALKIAN
jgi:hypothetical protein